MSFLPYGGGSAFGWAGAFSASAAIHGAAVAGWMGVFGGFFPDTSPEENDPSFLITLERLDADTLAGIIEQDGAEGEASPQEEETSEEPSPEFGEDPEPEIPEVEALPDPEEILPNDPQLETVTAIPVQPIEPVEPELTPVLTEEVSPITPTTNIPVETASVTPVMPEEIEILSPTAPSSPQQMAPTFNLTSSTPSERPEPSVQELALGDLIRRIRNAVSDPCLIALPRRDGAEGVGLEIIASNDRAMESFVASALTADDADIRQSRVLVDPRQCPALTYIRQNRDYPATRMGLRLDNTEIPSGGRLTGVIRGAPGRNITLLLVDDNGVVTDLNRFLSFSGHLARFDVPVTRVGPTRDANLLLIALGTRRAPTIIKDRAGRLAQDVFTGLTGELADEALLAVATFDVR